MNSKNAKFRRRIGLWLLMISAGVLSYGLGMYQGSQFRMARTIASDRVAIPAPIQATVEPEKKEAPALPVSAPVPSATSGSPNQNQAPKSR